MEEKSFYFVVVKLELIFSHPCFYVICACIEFFGDVGNFTERSGLLELCIIRKKLMIYRVIRSISDRGVVYRTKRMGPRTEP